jgi:hypothetical protein
VQEAVGGYATAHENERLSLVFPDEWLEKIPTEKRDGLCECLRDDPRPSYQDDERIYGMAFDCFQIRFQVKDGVLTVVDVK